MSNGDIEISKPLRPFTYPDSRWFLKHPKLDIAPIQYVWNRLSGMYPQWWSSNFKSRADLHNWSDSWVSAFEEKSISVKEMMHGFSRCTELHPTYPPTLGEFLQACRPAPNLEASFHEAVRGLAKRDLGEDFAYSSPAIYWASVELGFELRCMTFAQLAPRWKIALDYQVSLGKWEAVPVVAKQIGFQKQVTAAGQQHAERARQTFKRADDAIDHLAWARKIVQRLEAGDKSVPLLVAKNAREALGLAN